MAVAEAVDKREEDEEEDEKEEEVAGSRSLERESSSVSQC